MSGKARVGDASADPSNPLARWSSAVSLSDADRDEIDMHVKLAINAGLELVQALEKGEHLRKAAADRVLAKAFGGILPAILHGSALAREKNASEQLAVFHAGVTTYLSSQLATLSAMQSALQERRVELQRQRYEKLSDGAVRGKSSAHKSAPVQGAVGAIGGDIKSQLSDTQIQAFEEETSQMVKAMQADLEAVQHAEQQLHGIAELQTRIVQHLQEQNEHTSTLVDDAAIHGEQVSRGNVQLHKAKKRNRQANRLLSIFFVASGLALLFVHCALWLTGDRLAIRGVLVSSYAPCEVPNMGKRR